MTHRFPKFVHSSIIEFAVRKFYPPNRTEPNFSITNATSLKDVRCLSETGCVGRQRCLVFMSLASLRLSRDAKDAKDGLDIFLMCRRSACCWRILVEYWSLRKFNRRMACIVPFNATHGYWPDDLRTRRSTSIADDEPWFEQLGTQWLVSFNDVKFRFQSGRY